MKDAILKALEQLDPANDEHWTAEGLPSLEAIGKVEGKDLTRADLAAHANGFSREIAAGLKADRDQHQASAQTKVRGAKDLDDLNSPDLVAEAAPTDTETRRIELQANIDTLTEAIADHDLAVSKAAQMREGMVKERDEAIKALHAEFPPLKQAEATRLWLDQQARQRAERAGQQFVSPAPKSPLDQSFQRRTGHGHGRKQVPVFA